MIFTITEGARVNTAKIEVDRSLSTAMDSVLAEYYGPLWEEYHIFGFYTEADSDVARKEQIAEKLSDNMSYTFDTDKNLSMRGDSSLDLYQVVLNSVSVNNETGLMDYQGELLINEAVEYMKYREIGNGLKQLLDKLSLMETPKKVSIIYEEKQNAEEKLVEIDKGILELMELIDGLRTSNKGIEVAKDGSLMTADYFTKQICITEITPEEVGINQKQVFNALKDSYVNPKPDFVTIHECFTEITTIQESIEKINIKLQAAESELLIEQTTLGEKNANENKTKEGKQQIKDIKININSLDETIKDYKEEIEESEEEILQFISDINISKANIAALISGITPIIDKAILAVDNIILKTKTAAPIIDQYEKLLYSYKDQVGEEVFIGLEDGLKEMKDYVITGDSGYDFKGMKVILENDQNILEQTENYLGEAEDELTRVQYEKADKYYQNASEILRGYQIKGLTLDYSTLVLDHSLQKSSLSAINDLFKAGITSLVIDPSEISEKELSADTLPSEVAAMSYEGSDLITQLKDFFQSAATGGDNFSMDSLFGSFGSESNIADFSGKAVNTIAEQLLYQEYLKEHFEMYRAEDDGSSRKPSALTYEQEYLLVGKHTDQENMASVISRILFLRTILDFASVLGDSTRRNEARIAAAALVGFTGLPILVSITQGLILLTWSFAEALLDVCALMMGKEVPILKKKIILQLPELFIISRSFLQTKASSITSTKELSMSYQDYLRMFLLIKDKKELTFRSMDLMQENTKLRYKEESFDITDCLFGFEAAVDYTVPSKFTGISFVHKMLGTGAKGFQFKVKEAYSY